MLGVFKESLQQLAGTYSLIDGSNLPETEYITLPLIVRLLLPETDITLPFTVKLLLPEIEYTTLPLTVGLL